MSCVPVFMSTISLQSVHLDLLYLEVSTMRRFRSVAAVNERKWRFWGISKANERRICAGRRSVLLCLTCFSVVGVEWGTIDATSILRETCRRGEVARSAHLVFGPSSMHEHAAAPCRVGGLKVHADGSGPELCICLDTAEHERSGAEEMTAMEVEEGMRQLWQKWMHACRSLDLEDRKASGSDLMNDEKAEHTTTTISHTHTHQTNKTL